MLGYFFFKDNLNLKWPKGWSMFLASWLFETWPFLLVSGFHHNVMLIVKFFIVMLSFAFFIRCRMSLRSATLWWGLLCWVTLWRVIMLSAMASSWIAKRKNSKHTHAVTTFPFTFFGQLSLKWLVEGLGPGRALFYKIMKKPDPVRASGWPKFK
jgi:hypothetical protein